MTVIREARFVQSLQDALQHISYYHPLDYIRTLGDAYEQEQSPTARADIAQILTNSRMCAERFARDEGLPRRMAEDPRASRRKRPGTSLMTARASRIRHPRLRVPHRKSAFPIPQ